MSTWVKIVLTPTEIVSNYLLNMQPWLVIGDGTFEGVLYHRGIEFLVVENGFSSRFTQWLWSSHRVVVIFFTCISCKGVVIEYLQARKRVLHYSLLTIIFIALGALNQNETSHTLMLAKKLKKDSWKDSLSDQAYFECLSFKIKLHNNCNEPKLSIKWWFSNNNLMVPKPSLPFLQKDNQPWLPAKWYNKHYKGVAIA